MLRRMALNLLAVPFPRSLIAPARAAAFCVRTQPSTNIRIGGGTNVKPHTATDTRWEAVAQTARLLSGSKTSRPVRPECEPRAGTLPPPTAALLRKMADRIQARAIRRCGELLGEIPDTNRGRPKLIPDGTDRNITRTEAATDAGLSERQKVTALRVANVPAQEFEKAVESEAPPTGTRGSKSGAAAVRPPRT